MSLAFEMSPLELINARSSCLQLDQVTYQITVYDKH